MYSGQLIIDADYNTADGWEIVLRFDPENCEGSWSGLIDAQLPDLIGDAAAEALIADRDQQPRSSLLSVCQRLLAWEQAMGGFEAPAWDDLKKLLATQ